jgi:hypothetical protein
VRRLHAWLGLLVAFGLGPVGLCACSAPVVGNWQSDSELGNGKRNQLAVYDDFTAEATIHATPVNDTNTWIEFRFDAVWQDEGEEFDFEMTCDKGSCTKADEFTMECVAVEEDDGDEMLDCNAGQLWSKYPFDWERVVPD